MGSVGDNIVIHCLHLFTQGHHRLCQYLLQLKPELNIPIKSAIRHRTPLYFLCKDGNAELVKDFIEAGADVNSPGCLQVALETYNNDVAQILIDHGCDVNKVNMLLIILFETHSHTFNI